MTRAAALKLMMALSLVTSFVAQSFGDDKLILKRLEDKGAKVTAVKEQLQIAVGECSPWKEDDFKSLGSVAKVTSLSFGLGFNEASLPLLAGLKDLEAFSSNGMQITDEGLKTFTQFPKLKRLTFYHPPRSFSGKTLDQLAVLKQLEELSIGGSATLNDEAVAAISQIKTLKRLRLWHVRHTNVGVKHLKELPMLESLMIGQNGLNPETVCPNDETIALLLEVKTLKSLMLMETRANYGSLKRLKQLPELTRLTLDAVEVSDADLERLKQDLPKVTITHTKPSEAQSKRLEQLFGKT